MIKQRQIEAFRAVMTAGGVSAAAAFLNVSQPAVSRLIRDLEAQIGVALFERRSGGRLQPTRDALILFREVERYFISLDQITQTAAGLRDEASAASEWRPCLRFTSSCCRVLSVVFWLPARYWISSFTAPPPTS